jgi:hypothetical protein
MKFIESLKSFFNKAKQPAEVLLDQYKAAVNEVAARPETYTAEKQEQIANLQQQVFQAAPGMPNKGMGEILIAVADINRKLPKP